MHQSKLLAVLLVLFTLGSYAQEAPLLNKYANYFEHKPETIYTQLNKSNVLANENLWFQSYIYFNQESTPYASTTNVYYNIYDAYGHLVDQKVFNAKDGTVTGHIAIDDKYTTGVYYLKTTTNWMRNFNVDNSDLKTFVVNAETTASEQSTTGSGRFDDHTGRWQLDSKYLQHHWHKDWKEVGFQKDKGHNEERQWRNRKLCFHKRARARKVRYHIGQKRGLYCKRPPRWQGGCLQGH